MIDQGVAELRNKDLIIYVPDNVPENILGFKIENGEATHIRSGKKCYLSFVPNTTYNDLKFDSVMHGLVRIRK